MVGGIVPNVMRNMIHTSLRIPLLVSVAMLFSCIAQAASAPVVNANSPEEQRLPGQNMHPPGSADSDGAKPDEQHLLVAIEALTPQVDGLSEIYPLDLNSPRGTLWSMLVVLHNYRELLEENGRTLQNQDHLGWIQKRIARCFDLEDVGPEFQSSVATDAAVRLRSIIMRTSTDGWSAIPGDHELEGGNDGEDRTEYRFKSIPIVMQKITEGERNGQWVISSTTRETTEDILDHLMNNKSGTGPLGLRTFSSDKDSLYKNHFFQSGWMIPGNFTTSLPDFAGTRIIGQPLWKWALALIGGLIITTIIVTGYVLFIHKMKSANRPHEKVSIRDNIARFIYQIMIGCMMVLFQIFIKNQIFLDGAVLETLYTVTSLIMAIAFICAILSLSSVICEVTLGSPKINHDEFDEAFARVLIKTVAIIFAAVFLFQILQNLGFSPTTILAGAGVTGLALALAAQDMLKNFLASVILLIEKPFKNGDYIMVGEQAGVIKSIGMRSTSLVLSGGNTLYIPNSEIAQGEIQNFTHRAHIRSRINIGMTYSTNYERVNLAMKILKDILEDKVVSPEGRGPVVIFKSFDESCLTLEAKVTHEDTNNRACKQALSEVNLEILRQFNEEGLEFAFPTISIDIADDPRTHAQHE